MIFRMTKVGPKKCEGLPKLKKIVNLLKSNLEKRGEINKSWMETLKIILMSNKFYFRFEVLDTKR